MAGKQADIKVGVVTSYDGKGIDHAKKGMGDLDDKTTGLHDKLGKVGTVAAGAGVALGAFAAEGVIQFEHLGLEVGKLHDATGLSYDSASRLTEVFGDLGISGEDLQGALVKMEKKLGANQAAFEKYGVSVAHTKDGQVDANGTFLNAIDALNGMDDPLKRARAGADIFGKGWASMAEVIGEKGDKLRADLGAVSDAKIFDEKKVQQAKDLREAFDQIKDAGEDLFLTIGHALAPVIAKLAPTLAKVVQAAEPLAVAIGDVLGPALEAIGPIIEALMPIIEGLAKALSAVGTAIGFAMGPHSEAKKGLDSFNEQLAELKVKAEQAGISTDDFQKMVTASAQEAKDKGAKGFDVFGASIEILDGKLLNATDRTDSWSASAKTMFERSGHAKKGLDDVGDAAANAAPKMSEFDQSVKNADESYAHLIGLLDEKDAWANAKTQWDEFKGNAVATDQDVRDATRALAEFVKKADSIPAEKKTQFYALLDQGQLDLVEQQLAILSRNRDVNLNIIAKGGAGYGGLSGARASGGPVSAGGAYLVGEQGPELLQMGSSSGSITPNGALGGGNSYTINMSMPMLASGSDYYRAGQMIKNAIAAYESRNG